MELPTEMKVSPITVAVPFLLKLSFTYSMSCSVAQFHCVWLRPVSDKETIDAVSSIKVQT